MFPGEALVTAEGEESTQDDYLAFLCLLLDINTGVQAIETEAATHEVNRFV